MKSLCAKAALAAAIGLGVGGGGQMLRAQTPNASDIRGLNQLERFERSLDEIRQQTLYRVNPDIPPNQRAYFDYGIYLTASYLSLDDNNNENHGLRQYEMFP